MQLSRRGVLLTGGAGLLSLAACNGTASEQMETSSSPSPVAGALGKAVIGLTYIPNIQFAPFYWAADKGLFSAEGADVTLRHHGSNEGLFTALGSGQEQFVIAGGDEVVQARAEGLDLVTVAGYYQRYPVVLIVREDSPVRTLKDLRGRTIGLPGEYGESWFGLQLALRTAGLTRKEVTVQSIGYTQQAALATGKVDVIVGFSNNDVVQFAQSGVAVRQIALGEEVPLVSSSIITSRTVLDEDRELVRAVARAIVGGVQGVVDDPDEALRVSGSHVPGLSAAQATKSARATLEATIPLWKGDEARPSLRLEEGDFVAMESFMRDAGLVTKPVDASRAVDPSILA